MDQRDPLAVARWEGTYRNSHWSPERRLLLAVLDDALTRYRKVITGTGRCDVELAELQAWFACRAGPVPFGFEPICEQLGLDADGIRRRLAQLASTSPAPAPRRAPQPVAATCAAGRPAGARQRGGGARRCAASDPAAGDLRRDILASVPSGLPAAD
ncbi:MAG TPA: hypothetical protein VL049_09795 [Candidatus Dormibacteraeota bacterium]|nr:hypothetical protein [Candidatus Dormibacteraeota bacterium]